jgi:alkylhydroperoxidase/carboxymuconolactone decarboxylase family protein YurZ
MPDSSIPKSVRDDLYARFNKDALDTGIEIGGDGFLGRLIELDGLDTQWAEGFLNWVYGTVYRRRVLDRRTRELVTVGEHVVLGNDRAMKTHMKAALKFGAKREEIIEVCLNSAVYNGFPKAHHGLAVFYKAEKEYLDENKPKKPAARARKAGRRA